MLDPHEAADMPRFSDSDWATWTRFGENFVQQTDNWLRKKMGTVETYGKGRGDVLTEADLQIEERFAASLPSQFIDHAFFSEERWNNTRPQEFTWVLDPVDGTVNFAAEIPFFGVSLALMHQGYPLLGWVTNTISGEVFHARRGAGVWVNGKPVPKPVESGLARPIVLSSGLVQLLLKQNHGEALLHLIQRLGKFRNMGSQAIHLCYAGLGRLRINANLEAKLWDDAAGALFVMECGGHYSDLKDQAIFPLAGDHPGWQGKSIGSLSGEAEACGILLDLARQALV